MIFDTNFYSAENTYKIISERCYRCLIKNDAESKEGMFKARKDWDIFNEGADPEETEAFWAFSLHQNQLFKDLNVSLSNISFNTFPYSEEEAIEKNIPRYKAKLLHGIYCRETDKFLGFILNRINDRNIYVEMTCILPEYRDLGIATEVDVASGKYVFFEKDYLVSTARLPISDSGIIRSRIAVIKEFQDDGTHVIRDRYIANDKGTPVEYCTVNTTRDMFSYWINLPENTKLKESYFDFEEL